MPDSTGIRDKGYRFVGETLYSHADKSHDETTVTGERYVDPSLPGTAALLKALGGLGVPLLTHWEVYGWERDWPRFDVLYGAWARACWANAER